MAESRDFRVGVDIGGTFTDIVVLAADGRLHTRKVSSTSDDYARAIAQALAGLFSQTGLQPEQIHEVLHGTTVASNAILEGAGARTGLVTTRGFRDVLELRTLRMPRLYDLAWEKPPPLVPRYLRVEVDERVDAAGRSERSPSRENVAQAVDRLLAEGVEAIAVCLINSFANPAHERLVGEVIRERAPGLPFCLSVDVLPEIREYERTSTTVINAYLLPVVARYLDALVRELREAHIGAPLLMMQSNGGLTMAERATHLPCHIIESGPAGGVVGAHALARKLDLGDVVTFDMGGTTAKASLIEGGEYSRAVDFSVGAGIMVGSRLLTGAGYRLKVPAIDLAEVGAGGGSIVWVDPGGAMQIGPRSAGASPGPVCYGLGGEEPTVTDANVVLGYLNPAYLVGGALSIDASLSHAALEDKVAQPLGLALAHAAYGAHEIAASNMIRAIKAVSSERGRDPRRYALFAFGGNGPLFAATMARSLGMRRIVIPPAPGLFSSFGLLYADVEHHYSRTVRRVLREADPAELETAWCELEQRAREQLAAEGFPPERMRTRRAANMHYKGQIFELSVAIAAGPIDASRLPDLEASFGAEHERTYGHRAGPEEPVEIVNVEVVAQGIPERPRVPDALLPDTLLADRGAAAAGASRPAYFGPDVGWVETPVIARAALAASADGPFIVEEYDTTCLVPHNASASLDGYGNIVVELR
jgi:N-methylhydantoinase A